MVVERIGEETWNRRKKYCMTKLFTLLFLQAHRKGLGNSVSPEERQGVGRRGVQQAHHCLECQKSNPITP
jgi:hypothetical protein